MRIVRLRTSHFSVYCTAFTRGRTSIRESAASVCSNEDSGQKPEFQDRHHGAERISEAPRKNYLKIKIPLS